MVENSLDQLLKIDNQDYQIRQIVNVIYHRILESYIARANESDVLDQLYKFYTDSDVVLVSKDKFKYYQKLEELSLAVGSFKTESQNG